MTSHLCRTHGTKPQDHFFRQIIQSGRVTWTCRERRLASMRQYNHSEKGRARYRTYDRTEKRVGVFAAYNMSQKGTGRKRCYELSEKGRAVAFISDLKRGRI